MKDDAEELFQAGYRAQRAGDVARAVELYRQSIESQPTAEAHTFLGWAYSFQGKYLEAIEECKNAIRVDPAFGNPYNDIGAYLIELGKEEAAIPWLERAIEAPRYDPRHFPHFNLARVYARKYEYGRAMDHLRRAVELEPGYTVAAKELKKLQARMN